MHHVSSTVVMPSIGQEMYISVEIKTTLVLVVGQSRKALRTIRDHLMVGAQ